MFTRLKGDYLDSLPNVNPVCIVLSSQADKDVELAAKWKHCALTSEELKRPVVACELGMLVKHLLGYMWMMLC